MYNERIYRDSYVYNTISGLLNAFQSVFILMVLTRTLGVEAAGVFTIAYSVANLMLNIGKFGMRNFHATDISIKFSYDNYRHSRYFSTLLMLLISLFYVLISARSLHYSAEKTIIMLSVCLWKSVDSIEDVVHGELQRNGRLDIGAKEFTYRQLISIFLYIFTSIVLRDLLCATLVVTGGSIVAAVILLKRSKNIYEAESGVALSKEIDDTSEMRLKNLVVLFKECTPVFISSFLTFYLVNASKYAIDAKLDSGSQARFGFISMPVFVVGLLAQFVYMPILIRLAKDYNDGNLQKFKRKVLKQGLIILGITIVVLLGGALLGIPVLSILYGVDLSDLRTELCVLLFSSGLLAFSNLMLTIMTLMRHNKRTMIVFILASLVALIISGPMVAAYGLYGASYAMLISLGILAIGMGVTYGVTLHTL